MTVRQVLQNYVGTTSLKGIPKVIKSPTKVQKLLWAAGALFGICFGTYIVVRLFMAYFSYNTVVSIDETLTGSPFPDVTVCNLNPLPRNETMSGVDYTLGEYFAKMAHLRETLNMEDDYYVTLNNPQSFLQNIDENARRDNGSSFVVECKWASSDGQPVPCQYNKGYILQRGSTEYHTCVTFHMDYKPPRFDYSPVYGLGVLLYLNDFSNTILHDADVDVHLSYGRGVRVLLHSPNTLPLIGLTGMNLPPGTETTVSFTATKRSWMDEPYGDCTKRQYLDEDTKHYAYTKKACAEYLQQQRVIEKCQSLYPRLMTLKEQREQYPYCGKLYDDFNKTKQTLLCCIDAYYSPSSDFYELCKNPCTEYRYDTEVFSLPWPHEAYQMAYYRQYINNTAMQPKFKVYEDIAQQMKVDRDEGFKRLRQTDLFRRNFMQLNVMSKIPELMKDIQEIPATTVFSLIGTLGGAFNLWMGISFLTAIELLDLLYQICVQCKKQEERPASKPESVPMT